MIKKEKPRGLTHTHGILYTYIMHFLHVTLARYNLLHRAPSIKQITWHVPSQLIKRPWSHLKKSQGNNSRWMCPPTLYGAGLYWVVFAREQFVPTIVSHVTDHFPLLDLSLLPLCPFPFTLYISHTKPFLPCAKNHWSFTKYSDPKKRTKKKKKNHCQKTKAIVSLITWP